MFGDWNFLLLPHNFVTSLWLDYWRLSFCCNYMYFRNLNTTGKSCLMYLQHYKRYSLNQMPLQLFFINMYHCSSMFCICLQRNVAGRCHACSLGIINLSKNPSTLWPWSLMYNHVLSFFFCKWMQIHVWSINACLVQYPAFHVGQQCCQFIGAFTCWRS